MMIVLAMVIELFVSGTSFAAAQPATAGSLEPASLTPPVPPRAPAPSKGRRKPASLEVRQRRTRNAAIAMGSVAAASLIGVGVILGVADRPGVDNTDVERALGVVGTTAGLSLAALIGTGIGLGTLAREAEQGWPDGDPRLDANWAWKDRALTRHLIFWSSLFGVSVLGLSVCTGLLFGGGGDDDTAPAACSAAFLSFAGISAAPAVGVAVARRHHRWPRRAFQVGVGAGGLRLSF